ncbi:hypothetical protein CASFOL_027483 [Castilleja foliolosa]|uniref:Uncharacterized protein n=1 Tax=Castilleja foliolosa TaxID=1961234 RepID=A0ABD3CFT6_9LAMI
MDVVYRVVDIHVYRVVDIVYAPRQNLKKTVSMNVEQVGFYSSKAVRTVRVEKRINEIVNRLNKTKVERQPALKG